MGLKEDLDAELNAIFSGGFQERDGQKVPEPEDVRLGNDAVKIEGTVLYADLAESTALVRRYQWWFAAEVYKAYIITACRIIRNNYSIITAFDGDRVMAVYMGGSRDANAVRTALQINYAVSNLINKIIKSKFSKFSTEYLVKQSVGIDRSLLYAVRTGIRGSNDLVWVGTAANNAAKMCSIRDGYPTHISMEVYTQLDDATRYSSDSRTNMWESYYWNDISANICRSSYWWEI
jgi:class 3 adenylate cyclase